MTRRAIAAASSALLLAAATPARAAGEAPAAGTTQRAEALLLAVKRGDAQAAWALFGPVMKEKLPPGALENVLAGLEAQLGPVRSFAPRSASERGGLAVHEYDLTHERGALLAVVSVDPRSLEVAGFWLRPAEAKPPAPPASLPAGLAEVELRVGPAGKELGATLLLPPGKGPFPAALLLAGSGPIDRDGTVAGRKPLRDLAIALAGRGVATLRFDKRSAARPQDLDPAKVTVEEEHLADAAAALALLRGRPEADPRRLFVVGHSLGAFLAPEVAARGGPVAGLVLLAPPGRKATVLAAEQLRARGSPELAAQAEAIGSGTAPASASLLGAPAGWWRDLDRRDAIGAARKLGAPLLALRGGRDAQVAAADLAAWRRGVPGAQAETLDELDHLFMGPGATAFDGAAAARVAAFVSAPGR